MEGNKIEEMREPYYERGELGPYKGIRWKSGLSRLSHKASALCSVLSIQSTFDLIQKR
jgi:hypothetical protein